MKSNLRAARKVMSGAKHTARKRPAARSLIAQKIPVLMKEGKTQKQAVGEAYGMQRAGRLRAGGVYVPVGKKK